MTDPAPDPPASGAALLAGGDDTIAAVATATGRGAVALVRLSGPRALDIAGALGVPSLAPRTATLVTVRHPDGTVLDRALVTAFPAPRSYTGEDVVEFATHGGGAVVRSVLAAILAAGAREALPGEFTRRAVLNGKMDLLQAEAIGDLVDAPTDALRRAALDQVDGGLSRRLASLRDALVGLEALLAYDIDFPEEDDGPVAPRRIRSAAEALLASLDALLATAPRAARLRTGALVVIAGPPNAGKSSLFNALLGEARALVTPEAGTTRDAIEALLDTPRVPLRLVDTAGLRATDDLVERLGIEVSERYLRSADLVLACGDAPAAIDATVAAVRAITSAPLLPVRTKADLDAAGVAAAAAADMGARPRSGLAPPVWVSAETGDGLAALLGCVQGLLLGEPAAATSEAEAGGPAPVVAGLSGGLSAAAHRDGAVMLLRERQRAGVASARHELAEFLATWPTLPTPVAAVHLHMATEALDALVGRVTVDDVLDRVFRDFCVGK